MYTLENKQENKVFMDNIQIYMNNLKDIMDDINKEQINVVIDRLLYSYHRNSSIFIFGNGGSASTASHFATDFNKGVSAELTKRFKVICLNDNISIVTAIANDITYDDVYKFQLENFLKPNDLVIAISGSGNSRNVVRALEYAAKIGADTVGLVGYDGGSVKNIVNNTIHVESFDMQKVEDIHMMLCHLMMSIIRSHLC
ncbi:SIS domain-containing protein [Aeromonas jandaei]